MTTCPTPALDRYPSERRAWYMVFRQWEHFLPYQCGNHWHIAPEAESTPTCPTPFREAHPTEAMAKREAGQ